MTLPSRGKFDLKIEKNLKKNHFSQEQKLYYDHESYTYPSYRIKK